MEVKCGSLPKQVALRKRAAIRFHGQGVHTANEVIICYMHNTQTKGASSILSETTMSRIESAAKRASENQYRQASALFA